MGLDVATSPLLSGGGITGDLIRATDWSKTALGPVSTWPKSLLSAIGIVIHSRHPMFLFWGSELIQFYNDAYLPSFGQGKHPAAMGQAGRDCWQEIWPIIFPQIEAVMTRGQASWNEDALVPIHRNGRIEDVYWTYGYSPAFDDDGSIGGTLVVCTETTARVVASRRTDFIRRLSDKLADSGDLGEIIEVVSSSAGATADIPFLGTYRKVAGVWQVSTATSVSEARLALVTEAVRRGSKGLLALADGAQALVCTPKTPGVEAFVLGVSDRLPYDGAYAAFFDQLIEQVDLAAGRLEAARARTVVESERRNLLLQAPVGTAIMRGPTHVFELANPLYLEIVGGRDIVGKAYAEAFPEIAGGALAGVLDEVYATGVPFVADEYLVPLDRKGTGTPQDCYFRFNLEPIRDASGAVYGMMAVAVDITEQVRANQAKDEFLATVSHELRTPLTSILGWARILGDGAEPAVVQKGLAVIERNAKAQAQLIDDILDVSKIISGKIRMTMRPVEPATVVHAAVDTVRPAASAKGIRLTVTVDPNLGSVLADEYRLQQVVWNLVSNAVKFTPKGGDVRVAIACRNAHIVITVEDTGRGISPAFLPHVFERFRQDDASTTKQQAGLGLGLAIARHLIELHDGTVVARSEGEGRGATFEVRLPICAGHAGEARDAAAEVPRAQGKMGGLEDLHILVVDDHDDARELVVAVLEGAGAKVTQADSVATAMEALSSKDLAVLVSDIGMPGEDGYSLVKWMRATSRSSRALPAVAVTAFARSEDRDRALAAGFQEHVAKPVDPAALIELVARLARR